MTPQVEMTIDGVPVASAFYTRLISLTVTDKEGSSSDTFEAELNDGPPDFLALPRKGAVAEIRMGYAQTGLRPMGRFTVDQVSGECLTYKLKIGGKAVDMRASPLKQRAERHWDNATLGEVVKDLAEESGLEPVIAERLAAIRLPWIGQLDESPLHFLERLAGRYNGLFAIKAGKLLFGERGTGLSASGAALGTIVLRPELIIPNTLKFSLPDRAKYGKVVAYYQDEDEAKRVEVEAEGDADSEAVYRIPDAFANAGEAGEAAEAQAKALARGEGSVEVTIQGDTAVGAGMPLTFAAVRPGLDGVAMTVETAKHTFRDGEGYRTAVSAKLYDGKSAGKAGGQSGGSQQPGGDAADGASAPAATPAAGLPAVPPQWTGTRLGRTDDN